jgi:hypothetical protein
MTYTCPKCGDDVTEQVLRRQRAVRVEYRTAQPPPPPPVVVTCINGHIARY